jgi:plastocyanin
MRRIVGHLGAAAALALAVCAAGCNEGSASNKPASGDAGKPRAAGPSAAGGVGTIRGVVSLKGEPPEMREIANQPCHAGATPLHEETVVADDHGHLANVVVFLREAPASSGGSSSTGPVVLDQVNCQYVPHVLAIRTGQTLRVKTSDPAVHNVHTMSAANPARNISMDGGAAPVDLTFARPEEFTVRCDIHPWMNARVHVFDHGQFAVTKPDGSFELKDVPAGQYTLVFRHELFGDIEETIDVADKQTLTKDATYEKPGT